MAGWKIPEWNGHFKGNIIELNGDLYDVIALLLSWLGGLVLNRRSKSITDMSWASFSWIFVYLWIWNQFAPCLITSEGMGMNIRIQFRRLKFARNSVDAKHGWCTFPDRHPDMAILDLEPSKAMSIRYFHIYIHYIVYYIYTIYNIIYIYIYIYTLWHRGI
jgi:hypothetical protein